jgi:colanic acid/amylovoran biosynthesis glycosyltransferase
MRIAFIVTEFPSVSQTFVLNQITGLLDLGHEVEIFALRAGEPGKTHEDVRRYGLLERATWLPEVPRSRRGRMMRGLREALSHVRRHPAVILKALDFREFGRPATTFAVVLRSVPFLGKGPFDIVHCHFGPCGNVGLMAIRTGALSGRLVTAFHGFDLTSFVRKNGRGVYDGLFKHGDLCLPISRHWRSRLLEMGCSVEKVRVHHMGVDTRQFHFRGDEGRSANGTRILSIARLVEKKGIRYGLEAMGRVLERHPDAEYVIAGDGPLKPALRQMAEELGIKGRVRFTGWLSQEEVAGLMKESDILLAPSVTAEDGDQEGIPVVLMEALAMGMPVVSTFHSGIPELILDGKTGLLAPERDPGALAQKIMELIDNEALRRELRQNGRQYVQDEFDLEKLNRDLEGLFKGLLDHG